MRRVLTGLAALSLTACATTPAEPPSAVAALIADLTGSWSNQAQYDAAPETLKRPPAPGHPYDWLDLQYADFYAVAAPELGEHVVYLEWRRGDGEISRQRLWVFQEDEDGLASGMDFFTFRDAAPYAGRGAEAGAFAEITREALIGYPQGCTLQPHADPARGLQFEVSPQDCRITARSGREMGIFAAIRFEADAIEYSEAGVLPDGNYAFLVPGGMAYAFRRAED
jgi:hypothetical protein